MIKPGLTVHRLEAVPPVLDHGGVGRAAQPATSPAAVPSTCVDSKHTLASGSSSVTGGAYGRRGGARVEPYARQALALLRTAEQAAATCAGFGRAPSRSVPARLPYLLLPAALRAVPCDVSGVTLRLEISDTRTSSARWRWVNWSWSDRRSAARARARCGALGEGRVGAHCPPRPPVRTAPVRARARDAANRTSPARKARARAAWPSAISRG